MAGYNEALQSKNKPPKQSAGYLSVKEWHIPSAIRYRKYYCVLFGDVLQLFDNEKSYSSRKQTPKAQIDLQKVCSISETVQALRGQKTNTEFCFKLELHNQNEVVFSAKSKEEVKCWVDCLKHTKLFYENYSARENIKNKPTNDANRPSLKKEESDSTNEIKQHEIDPSDISLSIIMSHGPKYTVYMKPDGDFQELWAAVLKWLPGHYCEKCESCQLRRSTMELWSVDSEGIACKVNENFTNFQNKELYLLEHNYKLLVVHFEDSTFLVSPADISIKSKEVPEIELFTRKLTSIDCINAQLYLLTSSNSVTLPFSPDEQPLMDYFWERRGNEWSYRDRKGDKLLLKSRALIIPQPQATAEKCQELKTKKTFEEIRQKLAIKEIEKNQLKKKALKMTQAVNTATGFPVEWSTGSPSNSILSKEKSWNFKPCFNEVPTRVPSSDKQKPVPFDYMSDEDNCIVKERRSSEGDKTKQEGVHLFKRRSISESDAHIRRKGAIRHRKKSGKPTSQSNQNIENKERGGDRCCCTNEHLCQCASRTAEDIPTSENIDPVPSCPVRESQINVSSENVSSSESVPSSLNLKRLSVSSSEHDPASNSCASFDNSLEKTNQNYNPETPNEITSCTSDCEHMVVSSQKNHSCMKSNRHCCSYYRVESPCILKPILEQYARLSKGEEEVNSCDPPKNLCLSSIHLTNKDNHWVIENEEELTFNDNEVDNCDVFLLPLDIKVSFDSSTREWIVQKIQQDVNDSENNDSILINNDGELNLGMFLLSKQSVCPELTMLDNAIQKIFFQASLVEGLDDTKSPDLRKVVCLDFCSALHSILSHGLSTRRTLFGIAKHTLWEVVDAVTSSATPGATVLQKINRLGVHEDRLRLELFVCECLNKGALAEWFEWLLSQTQTLNTFYNDNALMMSKGNDVVQKLFCITFLQFQLSYFVEVEEKLKKERVTTFSFE